MKITRYTRSRSLIFSILFFRIAQNILATVIRTLRTNEIRHLKIEKKSVILKCSSFVEFKKGFEFWDRESVKQDPFSCSPPLFDLFRDLAGREELYIPYLQHFEPSLLSVNWFQTLSPNGISGISIRSHLVKPGHKTRLCYLDTYIYCRHVLTHKNQFMRFAFASNCDKFFRPAIIIIPALRHLFSSLWNRIKCWIHAIARNFNRRNPFFRSSCNS